MSATALSALALRFYARPATRERIDGSWQGGRWTEGIPLREPIRAVLQSTNDKDLSQLPEGERAEIYRVIWSEAELRTSDDGSARAADIVITEQGDRYRIIQSLPRHEGGFTRAIGEKIDDRGRRIGSR
ncbi:MAG TPA: hypothetical protein VGU72_01105 [Beijerinckiaceae bacterium]|jgi:hypothetical protein|nr:hypothetical protein [Beijerinckiaceae bacterium]